MFKKLKILAIIPARGGSKGIKLKNLKKIKNKTLIQYAYECIKKIKIVDCVAVSTDHELIKSHCKKLKDIKIIDRPKSLSGDKVSDIKVLRHSIKWTEKNIGKFDIVLMIQPTSVLRKPKHILEAIQILVKRKYDTVWSVSKVDLKFHYLKQLKIIKNKLSYVDNLGCNIISRQQLKNTYYRNGAVYAFNTNYLKKKTNFLLSPKNSSYLLTDNIQVSIDTYDDLKLAKSLI